MWYVVRYQSGRIMERSRTFPDFTEAKVEFREWRRRHPGAFLAIEPVEIKEIEETQPPARTLFTGIEKFWANPH